MIVVDTHVLVWIMMDDDRLGRQSRSLLEKARREDGVHVSAIAPWEIAMLVDKDRLSLGRRTEDWIKAALSEAGIFLMPIEPAIAVDAGQLPGDLHGDPADRLTTATARAKDCLLMTADRRILDYGAAGHVGVVDARV
jgi:PIN domain nuclease of toxin-antitoxin system